MSWDIDTLFILAAAFNSWKPCFVWSSFSVYNISMPSMLECLLWH